MEIVSQREPFFKCLKMKIALCLVQTNFIFYQKDKVIFQEYGYNITLNELNHNASG